MKARQFVVGALVASAAAIALPSFADVFIETAPPPLRVERFEPRPGHIWVRGHWEWRDGRHEWIPGHYVRERKGFFYQRDRRVMNDENRWVFQHGGWARDSDGDGVPDRFDRAPNNPYRQ